MNGGLNRALEGPVGRAGGSARKLLPRFPAVLPRDGQASVVTRKRTAKNLQVILTRCARQPIANLKNGARVAFPVCLQKPLSHGGQGLDHRAREEGRFAQEVVMEIENLLNVGVNVNL